MEMPHRLAVCLSLLILPIYLPGCATGPELEQRLKTSGKSFDEQFPRGTDRGNIFLHRDAQFLGGGSPVGVAFDETEIASLRGDTFILIPTNPGDHTITSDFFGNKKRFPIEVKAGQNYYLRVNIKTGPFPALKNYAVPELLPEEEGRHLIGGSHFLGIAPAVTREWANLKEGMAIADVVSLPKLDYIREQSAIIAHYADGRKEPLALFLHRIESGKIPPHSWITTDIAEFEFGDGQLTKWRAAPKGDLQLIRDFLKGK